MTKMINCYVCGTWAKLNKHNLYICPKCKAKFKVINKNKDNEQIVRYYESYAEYVED